MSDTAKTADEIINDALRAHPRGEEASKRMVPPQDADVVWYLTIRIHAPGTMSVQGHLGDPEFAVAQLEQAAEAVRRQIRPKAEIVIPNREVTLNPKLPLREMGDMLPHERGDG